MPATKPVPNWRAQQRLLALWRKAPPRVRAAGRAWYATARQELATLADMSGVPLERCVYAAAALSNNVDWRRNVVLTSRVLAGEPGGTFGHCVTKALRVIRDGEFGAVRGPKVEAFARALIGDTSAAVVDRHIFRAAGMHKQPTAKRYRDTIGALVLAANRVHVPVVVFQATVWLMQKRKDGAV